VKSTVGRPRRVTDAQIRIILAWRAELAELKAARKAVKTIRQLARELQLSTATISDVIRKHGLFKQPSPELREATLRHRRATLRVSDGPQQRTLTLSDAQFSAIVRWWGEKQALSRKKQSIPSKAQMARELGVARGTLDRLLAQASRHSPSGVVRVGRRRSRLARQYAQRLREWQRSQELIQLQRSRIPEARAFAAHLGVSLAMLRRALTELSRRR
jgi:DNA-binding transcriptional regulator YhcF (GntR family)